MPTNPFISPDFEIKWSAHTSDLIEPAIRQALSEGQAAIDAIASLPLDQVTYENTFRALESSTEMLNLA